ncbi:MAG: hypothetical protein LBG95_08625 [Treponema sp.]|jgi:hypothetical protein|nr:hypothetical protein [Treponema sp.]
MTITQTVDIPENHRLVIDVPREVPAGKGILTFTPMTEKNAAEGSVEFADASPEEVMAAGGEILDKHTAAFKATA